MQYTLYIRNENDKNFKEEDNKSQLVNELLAGYYDLTEEVEPVVAQA